jgi:hypothetical protein
MENQNNISTVLGMKGHGKTEKLKDLTVPEVNILWTDFFHEFGKRNAPYGFRIVNGLDDLHRHLLGGIFKPRSNFKFLYHPAERDPKDDEFHLQAILEMLKARFKKLKERTSIVIDEVDSYNHGNKSADAIEELVKRGRHFLIDQFYASRRPPEIPRLIKSQTNHFYVFKIIDELDLKFLKGIGFPPHVIAEIPNLRIGDYFHLDTTTRKIGAYRK